ncbi:MAG TPA: electron transport complex subunit E [Proteobacteria bacterium]|nr:electron transport complex protein RnfE [bacterium BMS3Abin14]HDL52810.1 electron transport complex subunit E [Pseudomonadota bacterium]
MTSYREEFTKGIFGENPVFRMVLGLCPTLAVTSSVINGIAMGLATLFVVVCSNTVVAFMRKIIPDKVRIPSFIIIIASFVTVVDLVMAAWAHPMHKTLGLFIPLIVVNCLILGRAEAFASRQPVLRSVVDGLGMGVGFTLSLALLGSVREILGSGTWLGINVLGGAYPDMLVMILPPGAFLAMGGLLGLFNVLQRS